jgi:hypothetical protein
MVADSNNLTLAAEMDGDGAVPQGVPKGQVQEEEKGDDLANRLAALRK